MSRIDHIHETLKSGGTIDAEDAVIYAQDQIKLAVAAAYERAAQVAEYALYESAGEPIRPGLVPIKKNETVETIANAIRALKSE